MDHTCFIPHFFDLHASKFAVSPSGCWLWTAAKTTAGYGKVGFRSGGTVRTIAAHRAAFESRHGRGSAGGHFVLHRCHNPACVNPDHLERGDHSLNMQQMVQAGRSPKGERNGQVQLSDDAVRRIRHALHSGEMLTVVARRFGVCHQTIKHCATGSTWAHVGRPVPARSIRYGKGARRILTRAIADDVRRRLTAGFAAKALANELGVSLPTIYAIKHNRIWADRRAA